LPLEPASTLTDVMGFRSPNVLDPAVPPRVAGPVADISGGRAVAQAQLDIDRWIEEGGSVASDPLDQAVALGLPLAGARRDAGGPEHAH
jgi:hypothetical protein